MSPTLWGGIIGGALGGIKGMTVDKDKERRDRALASDTARYSPWTKLDSQKVTIKEADPFGSAMQGFSQGSAQGQKFGAGGSSGPTAPGGDGGSVTPGSWGGVDSQSVSPNASSETALTGNEGMPTGDGGSGMAYANNDYSSLYDDQGLKKLGYKGYNPRQNTWNGVS